MPDPPYVIANALPGLCDDCFCQFFPFQLCDGHCKRCGMFHVVLPDPGIDFCRKLFSYSTGKMPARKVVPTEEQTPLKEMKGDAIMATSRHYSKTGRYSGELKDLVYAFRIWSFGVPLCKAVESTKSEIRTPDADLQL